MSYDQWKEHVKSLDSEVLAQLQKTSEEKSEAQLEDELVASSEDGRFFKKVISAVKKHVVDPVKQVATKGLDYFKQKAMEMAKPLIQKVLSPSTHAGPSGRNGCHVERNSFADTEYSGGGRCRRGWGRACVRACVRACGQRIVAPAYISANLFFSDLCAAID